MLNTESQQNVPEYSYNKEKKDFLFRCLWMQVPVCHSGTTHLKKQPRPYTRDKTIGVLVLNYLNPL